MLRGAVACAAALTMAGHAHAAVAGGHGIAALASDSALELGGYAPGSALTAEVVRAGLVVSTATGTVDGAGDLNVNPDACWSDYTPAILPGDTVRVSAPGMVTPDTTVVRGVTAGMPVLEGGIVVVHGTAADDRGRPLPIGEVQSRIIATAPFDVTGGQLSRRLTSAQPGFSISYDAPGSTAWTARYPGLDQHDIDLATADPATASRGVWANAAASEVTIHVAGGVAGPAGVCTAPLLAAPSTPVLEAASDTGASASDGITSVATPVLAGTASVGAVGGDPWDVEVRLAEVGPGGPVPIGKATVGPAGAIEISPDAPLADGEHRLTILQDLQSLPSSHTVPSRVVTVVVDTTAQTPVITATSPASRAATASPRVRGVAEPGSQVRIHVGADCSGAPAATGTQAEFAGAGIAVGVAPVGSTELHAQIVDAAGNVSACSGPLVYTAPAAEVIAAILPVGAPTPPQAGARVAPAALVSVGSGRVRVAGSLARITVRCSASASLVCIGRIALRAGAIRFGEKAFAVRGGRSTTISIALTRAARRALASGPLRVRARVVAHAGAGPADVRVSPLILVAARP